MEIITNSVEETEALGKKIGLMLSGDETLALYGGMGMGKTAFIRGLAAGLDIDPLEISSPTFALVHEHKCRTGMFYHFDMYRVDGWDSLYSTGFFDYLGNGIIAAEWSENIEGALPDDRIDIEISAPAELRRGADADVRLFKISGLRGELN